jgi:hypothetical protein
MNIKNIGNFVLVLILMMGVNLIGEYVDAKNFSLLYEAVQKVQKMINFEKIQKFKRLKFNELQKCKLEIFCQNLHF